MRLGVQARQLSLLDTFQGRSNRVLGEDVGHQRWHSHRDKLVRLCRRLSHFAALLLENASGACMNIRWLL